MKRLVALLLALVPSVSAAGPGDTADQKVAKMKTTHVHLALLNMAVEAYALDHFGQFPESLFELVSEDQAGRTYVAKDWLRDPWSGAYQFDKAGKKNDGERPDIWTKTPAGEQLGNWQDKPKINVLKLHHEVRIVAANALVEAVSKAMDAYIVKNGGDFPDTLEELLQGKNAILQKEALLDPWNQRFQYDKSGPRNKDKRPDIWTFVPSTEKLIGNWQDRSKIDPIQQLHDAKVKIARANLSQLTTAVNAYAAANKDRPLTLNMLTEGKSPFVLEKMLFDPWRKLYQYDPIGPLQEGKAPDIWTESPRRERIGNWEKEPTK